MIDTTNKKVNTISISEAEIKAARIIADNPEQYKEEDIIAARLKLLQLKKAVDVAVSSLDRSLGVIRSQKQLALDEVLAYTLPNGEGTAFGVEKKASYSVREGQLRRDAGVTVNVSFNNNTLSDLFSVNTSLKRQKVIAKFKAGDASVSQYVNEKVEEQLYFKDFDNIVVNESNEEGGDDNE